MEIWLFDFDGTLSTLVADRNAAVLHPVCAELLKVLSQSTTDRVAVISSRTLADILPRVPIEDVIIGGSSGIEWRFPGGCRVSLGANNKKLLNARRKKLMPLIDKIGRHPGIEIEDKQWSIAIHTKQLGQICLEKITKTIDEWADREKVSLHRGPNVLEIQFMPDFNKSKGVSFLADLLKFDPLIDSIFYAGDDENDAVAMRWVVQAGGTAIMVGSEHYVPGALCVNDQESLVEMVKMLRKR